MEIRDPKFLKLFGELQGCDFSVYPILCACYVHGIGAFKLGIKFHSEYHNYVPS